MLGISSSFCGCVDLKMGFFCFFVEFKRCGFRFCIIIGPVEEEFFGGQMRLKQQISSCGFSSAISRY
jgi:hypothetical protein